MSIGSRYLKKIILSLLLVALVAGTSGCNGNAAALGVGIAAGAIVGVVVGAAITESQYRRLPPPPAYVPYYRYCSRYRAEGWTVQHSPWGPYIVHQHRSYVVRCMSNDDLVPERISGQDVANALGIQLASAERLLKALHTASERDLSGITALGLTKADLFDIAQFRLPSKEAIQRISQTLSETPETVTQALQKLLDEAWEQQEERKRELIQSA